MTGKVVLIDHPLVQHKLTLMRRKSTSTGNFRRLTREISLLLAYEVTRDLPLRREAIETPMTSISAPLVDGKKLCFVSILRAGNGILEGMLDLVPSARVGHIGLYRDPQTLMAIEYYLKLPQDMSERRVIVLDSMIATGHSAVAAVHRLREHGALRIKMVCLLAAPEGIATFHEQHPEVDVYTAAVDEKLDENAYIIPGLGDAGDRMYGTK